MLLHELNKFFQLDLFVTFTKGNSNLPFGLRKVMRLKTLESSLFFGKLLNASELNQLKILFDCLNYRLNRRMR